MFSSDVFQLSHLKHDTISVQWRDNWSIWKDKTKGVKKDEAGKAESIDATSPLVVQRAALHIRLSSQFYVNIKIEEVDTYYLIYVQLCKSAIMEC